MMAAAGPAGVGGALFAPTYTAAQTSDTGGLALEVEMVNGEFGPSGCETKCEIWVETSTIDTFVRIDIPVQDGNQTDVLEWYNTSGVGQGDPGTDQNAMNLGERVDTVKVKITVQGDSADGCTISQIGTFTDDVAFNPTNFVNYGYDIECVSEVPPGATDIDAGQLNVEFTFVKAGFQDLVVEYRADAQSDAEDNS